MDNNMMVSALRRQRMGEDRPHGQPRDEGKEGGQLQELMDRVADLEQQVMEIKKAYGMDKEEKQPEAPAAKPGY